MFQFLLEMITGPVRKLFIPINCGSPMGVKWQSHGRDSASAGERFSRSIFPPFLCDITYVIPQIHTVFPIPFNGDHVLDPVIQGRTRRPLLAKGSNGVQVSEHRRPILFTVFAPFFSVFRFDGKRWQRSKKISRSGA